MQSSNGRSKYFFVTYTLLLICTGCFIADVDILPNSSGFEQIEPWYTVDSTQFRIKLLYMDSNGEEEYGLEEPVRVTFTNRTDSTLYLALCGGGTLPPTYQRRVDGIWRDAIRLATPAVGCTESLAVEPGDSYTEFHTLIFALASDQLPLDGPFPQISDVYGRYRMQFEVYGKSWVGGDAIPTDALLPRNLSVSNSFLLVAGE